jgi:hypothetical protein
MLIGIEFKRRKIYDEERGESIWFWRVAPYSKGCDTTKLAGALTFIFGMAALLAIGRYLQ